MKQENDSSTNDFYCLKCDFKCNKKGDWNRHILTQKHQTENHLKNVKSNIFSHLEKPINVFISYVLLILSSVIVF